MLYFETIAKCQTSALTSQLANDCRYLISTWSYVYSVSSPVSLETSFLYSAAARSVRVFSAVTPRDRPNVAPLISLITSHRILFSLHRSLPKTLVSVHKRLGSLSRLPLNISFKRARTLTHTKKKTTRSRLRVFKHHTRHNACYGNRTRATALQSAC